MMKMVTVYTAKGFILREEGGFIGFTVCSPSRDESSIVLTLSLGEAARFGERLICMEKGMSHLIDRAATTRVMLDYEGNFLFSQSLSNGDFQILARLDRWTTMMLADELIKPEKKKTAPTSTHPPSETSAPATTSPTRRPRGRAVRSS